MPKDDAFFDEEMLDNLQYDPFADSRGLVALFYRNLYAMAELRERLKEYEDAEEQEVLIKLPCKVGDIIYEPTNRNTINEYRVTGIKEEAFALWIEWKLEKGFVYQSIYGVEVGDIGKTVFLTKEEAEQALKKMRGE